MDCCYEDCGGYSVPPLVMPNNPARRCPDPTPCYPCLPSCGPRPPPQCPPPQCPPPPRSHPPQRSSPPQFCFQPSNPPTFCCPSQPPTGPQPCCYPQPPRGPPQPCCQPQPPQPCCFPQPPRGPPQPCCQPQPPQPSQSCCFPQPPRGPPQPCCLPQPCCSPQPPRCPEPQCGPPLCPRPRPSLPCCKPVCCNPVRTKYVMPCYRYEDGRIEEHVPTRHGTLPMSAYKRNGMQDQIHGYRGAIHYLCACEANDGRTAVCAKMEHIRRIYPKMTMEVRPVRTVK